MSEELTAEKWLDNNCEPHDSDEESEKLKDYIHACDVIKYVENYHKAKMDQLEGSPFFNPNRESGFMKEANGLRDEIHRLKACIEKWRDEYLEADDNEEFIASPELWDETLNIKPYIK